MTSYDFDIADRANIPAALTKIEQAMTPPAFEQAEGWLVALQVATAHRADSEFTSAVALSVYAAELTRWPADVAKWACERLARGKPGLTGPNWFPTLAELIAECSRFAAPRQVMLSALRNWGGPAPERFPTARGRAEPSAEEKAAVHAMALAVLADLKAADTLKTKRLAELPSISGKVDERGITAEMRELMERRRQEARS